LILKLEDVKNGDSERFQKIKEEVRAQLAASEFQHQIALWLDRQKATAFIHRAGAKAASAPEPVKSPEKPKEKT
jgi:hypothetical protein